MAKTGMIGNNQKEEEEEEEEEGDTQVTILRTGPKHKMRRLNIYITCNTGGGNSIVPWIRVLM